MAGNGRKTATTADKAAVEKKSPEIRGNGEDKVIVEDHNSSLEPEIAQIRRQWELASVLNFLVTFEPVIGSDLKLTAEEIENGLVKPDSSLARLHINLLKGIPPVSKTLNGTDAWVTALCKKIDAWWPWVAEGEMPLTAAKGEEINRYKELEPTTRLKILKALCEIRADQQDAVKYINSSLKSGCQMPTFRKNKLGGDEKATSYWYDGGMTIGHRLYKEVSKTEPKSKMKGKASNGPPTISLQWETLATNLDEFQKIVDELCSSKVAGETAVGKIIKTDIVPVVEKFQKKKERALKQKQRQERLLNDFRSYETGFTRSCRNLRTITYTFDDYDRAIDEAIEISKKRKTTKEIGTKKLSKKGKLASDAGRGSKESHSEDSDSDTATGSKDENIKKVDSLDSETETDSIEQDSKGDKNKASEDEDNDSKSSNYQGSDEDNDSKSDSYKGSSDEDNESKSGNYKDSSDEDIESKSDSYKAGESENSDMNCSSKPNGTRASKRLAGVNHHTRHLASKTRLRQRPTRNSALDNVVRDSEDESLSGKGDKSECDDCSPITDSEDASDG